MITLTKCEICTASYSTMREHCPICGSRRVFHCSHSYQPYCVVTRAQNPSGIETVRAFRTDMAFAFITAR